MNRFITGGGLNGFTKASRRVPIFFTKDGPGQAYARPQLAAEWPGVSNGYRAAGAPSYNWTFQEPSGDLIDTANDVHLVQNGAGTYGATVASWTKTWLSTTEVAQQDWRAPAGAGWNIATQSVVLIGWIVFTSSSGTRVWCTLSSTNCYAQIGSTGHVGIGMAGVFQNGTVDHRGAAVHPFMIEVIPGAGLLGHTGAGLLRLSTDVDQVTGTWALAGAVEAIKAIGANTSVAPPVAKYGGLAVWTGTDAETLSSYGPKAALGDLGFPISGY